MAAAAAAAAAMRLAVEGNIAVGKSTFVRLLRKAFPRWLLAPEPVAKWQRVTGGAASRCQATSPGFGNLLQMMYQDPSRWSYTFQTFSCLSRLKAQLQPPPAKVLQTGEPVWVFERSVYSDRYVFAKNLFEIGHLAEVEWTVYQEWHTFLLRAFGAQLFLDGFLYLRAPPETCMERLRQRGRVEEKDVSLGYLEQLHGQHEDWLVQRKTEIHSERLRAAPVLILNVMRDFEHDPEEQERLVSQVRSFTDALSAEPLPSPSASSASS